ncbi:MAG: hypothetical protein EBR82_35185 [Caulobacteraceae bacterium]|nr:hypothetical protein [Caulobacteraceae bacterium]
MKGGASTLRKQPKPKAKPAKPCGKLGTGYWPDHCPDCGGAMTFIISRAVEHTTRKCTRRDCARVVTAAQAIGSTSSQRTFPRPPGYGDEGKEIDPQTTGDQANP